MTTYDDVPAMIRFVCEDCGRAYVPPVGARRADSARFLDEAARRRQSKEDDQAYQLFCQSMHICPECLRCICHECWPGSSKKCGPCAGVAPALAASPALASGQLVDVAPTAGLPAETTGAPSFPYGRSGDRPPSGSARMAPPAEPLRYLGAKRPEVTPAPRRKTSGGLGSVRVRAAFACVAILLLIGAGVRRAGLTSATTGSAGLADETATPYRSAGDEGNPSGTADSLLGPSRSGSPEAPSARGVGKGSSKTLGPTLAPGATAMPTPRPTAGATATVTAGAPATATPPPTDTPAPTPSPTPAPTAPGQPAISCLPSTRGEGVHYSVTCTIDAGWLPGDQQHWWMDGSEYVDSQGWPPITDSATYSIYLVIVRAGLSSPQSNTVSGTDTTGWGLP